MRARLLCVCTVLIALVCNAYLLWGQPVTDGLGNVGIGTFAPHRSSILETSSNSKGLLLPRLTTAQRDAISGPAHALLLFNTTDTVFEYNIGDEINPIWYRFVVANNDGQLRAQLSPGALWFGGIDSLSTELAAGTPGQILSVNSAGTAPEWVSLSALDYWALGGNAGLSSNILGTLDATSIDIRTNNISRITIDAVTGQATINNGLDMSGANSALELSGDPGTTNQLLQSGGPGTTPTWTNDLVVNNVTVNGGLSGAGPNRFVGSVPIPVGVFQMNIPYTGIQAGAAVNVSIVDANAVIGVVPIRVTAITPGVGFTVEFTVTYDSPTGAIHYIVVNP